METAEKNLIDKKYENVLQVLSECTDDYIYIFDLKNDFYRVSTEILEAYNLPAERFGNASEHILEVVHPDDKHCGRMYHGQSDYLRCVEQCFAGSCSFESTEGLSGFVEASDECLTPDADWSSQPIAGMVGRLGRSEGPASSHLACIWLVPK